jgi:hypothetical protein
MYLLFYSTIVASSIFEPTQWGHTWSLKKICSPSIHVCDFRLLLLPVEQVTFTVFYEYQSLWPIFPWENHHCEKHGNIQISPNLSHKLWKRLAPGMPGRSYQTKPVLPSGCQVNIKCFYAKRTCLCSNNRSMVQKVIPGYLQRTVDNYSWAYLWLISHDLSHGVPLMLLK